MSDTIYAAHRGYSSIAPENSIPAFEEAVKHGFGAVECDVWQAREDGGGPQLMIMHDENLSRMCGVNVRITKLTKSELAEYPIIRGKNIGKYGGSLPIPTFEDYLQILETTEAIPIVEIKSREPENEENAISEETARHLTSLLYNKLPGRLAVVQSFNLHSLYRLKPFIRKNTQLLYLVKKPALIKSERILEYKKAGIAGISAKYTILSSTSISRIHKCGCKLAVWTVDSRALARKLAAADHVEYVISNKIYK
ncbi:MAG: glycerophosphodiester phosphodiesterase family protein [Clostridiales Family XIII bacterium]|nr:hypothetical protein [Clostridia bacterium]MDY3009683.1 glycerophosphodiester phosphodiesterase family protein [Clostridiales Family XIII bacterium]